MTRYPLCRKDGAGSLHKPSPTTQRGVKKATAFCERASMAYYTHYLLVQAPSHWSSKFFLLSKDIFLLMGQWLQVGDPSRDKKKNFYNLTFYQQFFSWRDSTLHGICSRDLQVCGPSRDQNERFPRPDLRAGHLPISQPVHLLSLFNSCSLLSLSFLLLLLWSLFVSQCTFYHCWLVFYCCFRFYRLLLAL